MPVKSVPTLGWTKRSVAATILFVTEEQQREIARRVAALMEAQSLTNEKLAFKAGVSTKTVSRVLNARNESRGGTLEKIAAALGVSEWDLRPVPPDPLGLDAAVPEPDVVSQLARIDQRLSAIEDAVDALTKQAGRLTATERDLLKQVGAALDRLGRDVGRGQPQQRSGPGTQPEAA